MSSCCSHTKLVPRCPYGRPASEQALHGRVRPNRAAARTEHCPGDGHGASLDHALDGHFVRFDADARRRRPVTM